MPDIWRFYHIRNCQYTHPPKDKLVIIVCRDVGFLGFLINTNINQFILNRPDLLVCQVAIKASDYWFIDHDSYINCAQLFLFKDAKLVDGREFVNEQIKAEIKKAVSNAKTIEKRYQELILNSP